MFKRTDNPVRRMPLWKWIILFILGCVLSMFLYGFSSLLNQVASSTLLAVVINITTSAGMLGIYYLCVRIFEDREVSELSLGRLLPDTGRGIVTAIGYFVCIVLVMAICGCYRITGTELDLAHQIRAISMFMMVAVGEEFIFRGVIFRTIDQKFGTIAALIISALLFGFVHYSNPGGTVWSSIAIALEAGVLLALAYKVTNTLWLPIGIHWAWNYTQGNILGFEVSGTNAGSSIFLSEVHGPEIITGGAFGAEASIIAVIFGLAISFMFAKEIMKNEKNEPIAELPKEEAEPSVTSIE